MAKLVIKRYATALFDIAKSEGQMALYEEQVGAIVKALNDESDFMAVLENHKVTMNEKISLLENIFTDKVENPILGLLVLLVKKGRQAEILSILEGFLEKVKKESGIIKATVTSAVKLNNEQIAAIRSKLEANTESEIELETIIDEDIIAGLIIRVGDKVVDASIRGEMQTLKKQLSEIKLA